jgi:hypothetical protein
MRAREEADRWTRDPMGQSPRGVGGANRVVLAVGDLTGGEVTTIVITVPWRSCWCKRHDRRSSGIGLPSPMVERRRRWSPAGHPRPCHGHRKGARAPVSRGEQDARARRAKGGAERRAPRSGSLRWARLELRRAIHAEGRLTTGNMCEHGLREGKAELGARWRRRWCDAVAGTAAPVMARARPRGGGDARALLLRLAS